MRVGGRRVDIKRTTDLFAKIEKVLLTRQAPFIIKTNGRYCKPFLARSSRAILVLDHSGRLGSPTL